MYSTNNDGKSSVAERFIRTIKIKILILKNVYTDKLDDIANKYNNTYHSTIKKKPVGVKNDTYIDFKNNGVDPKFKVSDYVRISK